MENVTKITPCLLFSVRNFFVIKHIVFGVTEKRYLKGIAAGWEIFLNFGRKITAVEDRFNTYIENMDGDAWRAMCVSEGTLRRYAKGEEFVAIGTVGRYIGYVAKGRLKYVAYSDDGTEHVMGLEFAGGFVADWPFSLYGRAAKLAIVAESECEIYCVALSRIRQMISENADFKDLVMHSTEAVFTTVYERYIDLYCKSPRQRYDELVTLHPNLFEQFSLKDIASFLNITPTHLSRLRKKDC